MSLIAFFEKFNCVSDMSASEVFDARGGRGGGLGR